LSEPAGDVAIDASRPRSTAALLAMVLAAIGICAALVALGTWQLQRRAWKLDLIQRVDERVHAPALAAPGPGLWPQLSAARDEYRHVRASGTYLYGRQTFVQASTEWGSGFWVLTPLQMPDGAVLLINRGFVLAEQREPAARAPGMPRADRATPIDAIPNSDAGAGADAGPVAVTGLLRMSEPGGSLLRHNDPAAGRWYSRDVAAIAAARGLNTVAPYFVDADADTPVAALADAGAVPVAGLTVIAFPNNHLAYAITWYTLALMVLGAAATLLHSEYRLGRLAPLGRARPPDSLDSAPDRAPDPAPDHAPGRAASAKPGANA